jgi:hypothetical protein
MCIDGCVLDFTTIMCIDGCILDFITFKCLRFYHIYVSWFYHTYVFRRTTSSTDLHPFLKRSLYLLRFHHFIVYTGCGTFLKRVCHNTRTLLSYLHFYARTYKSIYRLITKTHPSMHIIVVKSKAHPSMHLNWYYDFHNNVQSTIRLTKEAVYREGNR